MLLSQQSNLSPGTDIRHSTILAGLDFLGVHATVLAPGGPAGEFPARAQFVPLSTRGFGLAHRALRRFLVAPVMGNAFFWSPATLQRQIRTLARSVISIRPSVDLLQGEQQLASMAAVEAGRELDLPVVADFHGMWSEELLAYGSTRSGSRADGNIRTLESRIVRGADHVTVVSPEMREYLLSNVAADPGRVSVVGNGTFPRIASVPPRPNPRRIVYAGMLSPLQNTGLLIQALRIVCRQMPHVEVYLTDRGELARSVRRQCRKFDLPAKFFWFPDTKGFFQFLASCDVGLLPMNSDVGRQIARPSKLYGYMSVGLPVVTNRSASWSSFVEEEDIGTVTDSSPASFANGILELLRDPNRIRHCGERALTLLRTKYAYTKEIEKLTAIYSNLTGADVRPAPVESAVATAPSPASTLPEGRAT
jgi:glycosyltransferase involved in cell wall biosynthesis